MTKRKLSEVLTAQTDSEMRANNVYMAKLLWKLDTAVGSVVDELSDEGGRVYFGNTNQADELKDIAGELEGFRWEMILGAAKQRDLFAEMRTLRESCTAQAAALQSVKGWIEHWQRDVAGNLKPTEQSMETALAEVSAALSQGAGQ